MTNYFYALIFLWLIWAAELSAAETSETLARQWLAVATDIEQRDHEVREFAENVLRRHPEWALPVIREILIERAGSASVQRQIAARLLGAIGEISDEKSLLALLNDADYFVKMNAWQALPDFYARTPESATVARLRGDFPLSPLPETLLVKLQAAVLFGVFKTGNLSVKIESEILPLLKSLDLTLRRAAATTLRLAHSDAAAAALLTELADAQLSYAYFADICAALRQLKPASAAANLQNFLRRDSAWAIPAAGVLAASGNEIARQKLRELASTENPQRFAALTELRGIETTPEIFWQALDDPSLKIRRLALDALDQWLSSPVAKIRKTDALFSAIAEIAQSDRTPEIRAAAAKIFAKLDRPAAINGLREAAANPTGNRDFRLAAIAALGDLAASEATRALAECAQDNDLAIAVAAVKSLIKIPDTTAQLWTITGDPRQAVATAAREELYARSGGDPGHTPASRQAWREKFLPAE